MPTGEVPGGRPLQVRVLGREDELTPLREAWDALAVAAGAPTATPAWQLAWWRHLAPPGATLRVVVVEEGAELIGIAPFAATHDRRGRVHYRLLGAELAHRVAPLAASGRLGQVASLVAGALAEVAPRPDFVHLDSIDVDGPWLPALCDGWPGARAPWTLRERVDAGPVVELAHVTFDGWLRTKSAHFRERVRREQRLFARAGGSVRMADSRAQLERDAATFVRLHDARSQQMARRSNLDARAERLICDAGAELVPGARMRLFVAELEGTPVAVHVCLAAGGVVSGWNSGFDPTAGRLKVSSVTLLAVIEDAIARGDRELDLGAGATPHKLRFASADRPLAWAQLVPPGSHELRNRTVLLRRRLCSVAGRYARRLPPALRPSWLERRIRDRRVGGADARAS